MSVEFGKRSTMKRWYYGEVVETKTPFSAERARFWSDVACPAAKIGHFWELFYSVMDFFVWPLKWKPLTSTLQCMKKIWNSGIIGRPRVKKWPKMCKVGHNLWILMLSRWWLCWGEKGPFKAFKNMGHVWKLVDAQKISSKLSMISHFFVILTTFWPLLTKFEASSEYSMVDLL